MPAVGVPVTLRILSAPEPREQSPRSCTASIISNGVLRFDLANLNVRAGRHMRVATAVTLGEIGAAPRTGALDDSIGNAQAAHI